MGSDLDRPPDKSFEDLFNNSAKHSGQKITAPEIPTQSVSLDDIKVFAPDVTEKDEDDVGGKGKKKKRKKENGKDGLDKVPVPATVEEVVESTTDEAGGENLPLTEISKLNGMPMEVGTMSHEKDTNDSLTRVFTMAVLHWVNALPEDGVLVLPKFEKVDGILVRNKKEKIEIRVDENFIEKLDDGSEQGEIIFRQLTEKFLERMVSHGVMKITDGVATMRGDKSDKDVMAAMFVMKDLVGIDTKFEFVPHEKNIQEGEIYVDMGNRDGLSYVVEWVKNKFVVTVFFDHHGKESDSDMSATAWVFETLSALGMIEEWQKYIPFVELINLMDNGSLPKNYSDAVEKSGLTRRGYFLQIYPRTLFGLKKDIDPRILSSAIVNDKVDFLDQIPDKKLWKYRIKQKWENNRAVDYLEKQLSKTNKAVDKIQEIERIGLVFESHEYGKIVLDIDGELGGVGNETCRALGYDGILSWSPKKQSFRFSSFNKDITELGFTEDYGFTVRKRMQVKKGESGELKINLEDILEKISGSKRFEFSHGFLGEQIETLPEATMSAETLKGYCAGTWGSLFEDIEQITEVNNENELNEKIQKFRSYCASKRIVEAGIVIRSVEEGKKILDVFKDIREKRTIELDTETEKLLSGFGFNLKIFKESMEKKFREERWDGSVWSDFEIAIQEPSTTERRLAREAAQIRITDDRKINFLKATTESDTKIIGDLIKAIHVAASGSDATDMKVEDAKDLIKNYFDPVVENKEHSLVEEIKVNSDDVVYIARDLSVLAFGSDKISSSKKEALERLQKLGIKQIEIIDEVEKAKYNAALERLSINLGENDARYRWGADVNGAREYIFNLHGLALSSDDEKVEPYFVYKQTTSDHVIGKDETKRNEPGKKSEKTVKVVDPVWSSEVLNSLDIATNSGSTLQERSAARKLLAENGFKMKDDPSEDLKVYEAISLLVGHGNDYGNKEFGRDVQAAENYLRIYFGVKPDADTEDGDRDTVVDAPQEVIDKDEIEQGAIKELQTKYREMPEDEVFSRFEGWIVSKGSRGGGVLNQWKAQMPKLSKKAREDALKQLKMTLMLFENASLRILNNDNADHWIKAGMGILRSLNLEDKV